MHVMTKYLDTRKATINALCDYQAMEHLAGGASDAEKEMLRQDLACPASPAMDGLPRAHDPHAGEQRLAATLDKINLISEQQAQARQYLDWFFPARATLTDDERFILETFYLGQGSQEDRVAQLADHYYIEKDSVYRRKNRALDRFTVALYGRF
ncbi:hypothetical protein QEU97_06815 [Trueperella pyogenes]|uniref:hypothetical protein n=1 Tax=Trueperella pyogenes TaxID=1661 RepID=UPI0031334F5E